MYEPQSIHYEPQTIHYGQSQLINYQQSQPTHYEQPQPVHVSDQNIPQSYIVSNQTPTQTVQPPALTTNVPSTQPIVTTAYLPNNAQVSPNFVYTPSEEVARILKEFKSSDLYLSNKDTKQAQSSPPLMQPQNNYESIKSAALHKPHQENSHLNSQNPQFYNPSYDQNKTYDNNSVYNLPLSSPYNHNSYNAQDVNNLPSKYEEAPKSSIAPISKLLFIKHIFIII